MLKNRLRRTFNTFFETRSTVQMVLIGLLIIVLFGSLDYLTGYELSFSIFYLFPIALVTWYAGMRTGISACMAAAITWFIVDYASGHEYSYRVIQVWNATVRLGFFVVTSYLLAELKYRLKQEEKLAQIDGLTGLLNSRTFKAAVSRRLQLAARYHHPLAIGYIDLDNFKTVNDTLGHAEGDRVLQTTGALLAKSVRETDIVGRLGGDEFAVVLSETDLAGTEKVFGKLRDQLMQAVNDAGWPIGFSMGVAIFNKAPASTDDALRCADNLMYQIKYDSKNDVIYQEFNSEASIQV